MGIGSKVALQTAQGFVKGTKKKRVRVLFDSRSEKSFVTARVMNEAGLSAIRKEWLEIKTFGGSEAKGGSLRQVVCLEPVRGERSSVRLEAYVVPEISKISNDRPDIVKREYAHLKDLWLSDVCKERGLLEIDMLIGADYL